MIKTLVNHGNSMALIIDKPLLDILKIKPTEPLEITTDGVNIFISPVKSEKRYLKFSKALGSAAARHAESLRRLAG